ncbi:MAG: 50S ribosomal protein L24 [Bacteroidota bacterium]|nr:50S ribosomal protein L24 [Bacteroidota bacterium]MDP4231103.1 50S ribosomal protein L24 [Bacteroidota bacterium]MDP4236869.1 50S ribosomal protein L24 [Bacteroidota bacterium]
MKIKKNDIVEVITGKSRGKRGKVLKIYEEKQRVLVEGVNIMKRHERPSQRNQQGGINEREFPVHVSNVMLIDPKTSERTRIGRNVTTSADGRTRYERYAKKSGEAIA